MVAADRIWAPESPAYDAFFKAARGDNVHDLEKALTPEIDINALQGDGFEGQAALHMAASFGSIETIRFLNSGAGVDTPVAGVTSSALIAAAGHGKIDVFNLLLAHADEETISKNFEALHMAASLGHASLVELMLNRGFEIEAKDHHDSNTPLHSVCAASEAYPDVVRLLLSRGADLDARNKNGDTALHAVAWRSDPEVVKLLQDAGADPNARNHNDQSPLMIFASKITSICVNRYEIYGQGSNPRLEAFQLLLAAGFDVNAKDVRGRTALHELAMCPPWGHMAQGRVKAAELLMQAGIEVDAMDADRKMASQLFKHRDDLTLAQLLLGERFSADIRY